MPAKDYASTRFSGLDQINTQNVKDLKTAFTFSTGLTRGHEAAPLVINDTMYIVTPYPNYLFALDLSTPGAPLKWKYDPKPASASQGVACCDVVNRGAAYSNGKIFFNTLDNQTIAVDANTGAEVWRTKLGDINKGETMTMAPLVGARPRNAVFSPDGRRAYVTAENGGTITVVNARKHSVVGTINLSGGQLKPMGIAISRNGRRLYVSNGRGNSVSVINTTNNRIIASIPVASRPWGIALTPDGKKLYTANGLSDDVAVIDTVTNRVITTIRAGLGPWGIAISEQ